MPAFECWPQCHQQRSGAQDDREQQHELLYRRSAFVSLNIQSDLPMRISVCHFVAEGIARFSDKFPKRAKKDEKSLRRGLPAPLTKVAKKAPTIGKQSGNAAMRAAFLGNVVLLPTEEVAPRKGRYIEKRTKIGGRGGFNAQAMLREGMQETEAGRV